MAKMLEKYWSGREDSNLRPLPPEDSSASSFARFSGVFRNLNSGTKGEYLRFAGRFYRAITAGLFAAFALSGCSQRLADDYRSLWTDPETGCVYYVVDTKYGSARVYSMTIRFKADGTPDCPGAGGAA